MALIRLAAVLAALGPVVAGADVLPAAQALVQRHWYEARTAHFNIYSCGNGREVALLAARLEQFRGAYALLAGAPAVASPPIVVMAYPDPETMRPFLPLYQGRPANLTAFFNHGADENLIVLPVSGIGTNVMDVIYHEYTHLLLRHNDRFWPLWLKEGMAEVYSTFEVTGPHTARIGLPIGRHLDLLANEPMMPLGELFSVAHDSPQYNESARQGMFYAESWLLTDYLMLGDNAAYKARFGELTRLLREGRPPTEAFAGAFRAPLPVMEAELRKYLERGKFEPMVLNVAADLTAPQVLSTRAVTPVETWYRLGDQLQRVDRGDAAGECFRAGQELAPASPLPLEGLGLAAAERDEHGEAVRLLGRALELGSTNYLAHYLYARERLRMSASSDGNYTRIEGSAAAEIRAELEKSLRLMPDFGPAHNLLGFFELVQGDDLAGAEGHLKRAMQLEPEDESCELSLAQVQMRENDAAAARRTLGSLELPYVDKEVRTVAGELMKELDSPVQGSAGKP
jgi:tetratricopeptide (TPR) repeat protein